MTKRTIVETRLFNREVEKLQKAKKLNKEDLQDFKKRLTENPEEGDLIRGTGGVRKTRIKSASKGKSGGFRVCYFDFPNEEQLFLILIYPKNEQENISPEEQKQLKWFTDEIKKAKTEKK